MPGVLVKTSRVSLGTSCPPPLHLGPDVDPEDDEDYLKPSRGGMRVYFALSPQLGEVKVGVSSNPERRVKKQGLDLLGHVAGGRDLERSLHRRFADRRTGREWFTAEILPEVQGILQAA